MHYTEPFRDRMFERTVFFTWRSILRRRSLLKRGELTEQTAFFRKLLFGKINLFRYRKKVSVSSVPLFNKLLPGRAWTQLGSVNIQFSKTYEAGYGVTPLAGAWPYAVM